MKFEEIKVNESYIVYEDVENVVSKCDISMIVITKDEDGHFSTWAILDFPHFQPIKKELPKEGLLVYNHNIYYRTGGESGYGFRNSGEYVVSENLAFLSHPEDWQPATSEQVKEFIKLLEEEAKKIGFNDDTLLEGHANTEKKRRVK